MGKPKLWLCFEELVATGVRAREREREAYECAGGTLPDLSPSLVAALPSPRPDSDGGLSLDECGGLSLSPCSSLLFTPPTPTPPPLTLTLPLELVLLPFWTTSGRLC